MLIGKYLGSLGQLDGVVASKEGFEPQLGASCCSIPLGMRALSMARQIGYGRLQRGIEPSRVPSLQGLHKLAYDMHGTHGDLTRGYGYLREELGHIGQKSFERSGGNGSPNQPLNDGGIGGVKGI